MAEEYRVSQLEWEEMKAMCPLENTFGPEHAERLRGQQTVIEDIRSKMKIEEERQDWSAVAKLYMNEYRPEKERYRQLQLPFNEMDRAFTDEYNGKASNGNATSKVVQGFVDFTKLDYLVDEEPRRIKKKDK